MSLLLIYMLAGVSLISEVEVPTVTERGFILTWTTKAPELCQVGLEREGSSWSALVEESGPATRFHQVEVQGLEPGGDYRYLITCGKDRWPRLPWHSASITTLVPPPGKPLFSFAVMNDLHAGEDISGLMVPPVKWLPPFTPGKTWRFPVDNPWDFALRHTVREINRTEAELVIVNGDLTSWFSPEEFALVKDRLDRLNAPYHVVRGNHDRIGDYSEDYFLTTFNLDKSWFSFDHRGFRFIILDDTRPEDGYYQFTEEQFEWLARDLAEHRDRVTFIFSHRPIASRGLDIDPRMQRRLLELIAEHPQVAAVFNGHSHRARVTRVPEITGDLPFIEVPPVKDYPLGFGLVRVYQGGFMFNFRPTDCPDCREWRQMTRGHYYRLAPRLLFGRLEDRNFTAEFSPLQKNLIGLISSRTPTNAARPLMTPQSAYHAGRSERHGL